MAIRARRDGHDSPARRWARGVWIPEPPEGADEGFTLIELMVVVLIMAILVGMAIPTFLGARARAQDRAAQSSLVLAEKAASVIPLEQGEFPKNSVLLSELPSIEPALEWLDHTDPSTGPGQISIDDDLDGAELVLAARSDSGTYFYLIIVVDAPSRRGFEQGVSCEAHDFQGRPDTGW